MGLGGRLGGGAAGGRVGDATMPPLAAVALVSPVANAHGLTLWEPLGNRLRPTGVAVFAAAGARAAMAAHDLADGVGSQAKAVRSIGTMFRDRAVVRTYTSEAHAEVLLHAHADLGPALAQFLYERVQLVLVEGLVLVTGPAPAVGGPAPPPWVGAEPPKEGEADAGVAEPPAAWPESGGKGRPPIPPYGLRNNPRIPLDTIRTPRLRTPPPQERP